MTKQGRLVWDYTNNQVRFGDSDEWIALHREIDTGCRRVVVETSTVLLSRQETDIPVCITREGRRSIPYEGITEALKVPNLSHVYSGRSVLPARFTKLRVRVVNADTREQVISKGTLLGKLERAEVVETSNEPSSEKLIASEVDVVEQMMSSLPKELTKEQQRAVKELLTEHENIFSKGEYDIGRTPYVEYRIDTGPHRPIRQALRRHPFKYLEFWTLLTSKLRR